MSDTEVFCWIKSALSEISLLENGKGKRLLENCGRECAKFHALSVEAKRIRFEVKDKDDTDLLFQTYKEKVYNTNRLYKEAGVIFLEYHN